MVLGLSWAEDYGLSTVSKGQLSETSWGIVRPGFPDVGVVYGATRNGEES